MSHALTLRTGFLREHSPVLALSVLLHLALLVLLVANLNLMPRRQPQPVRLAIQATVVDTQAMRQRAAEEERLLREAQERQRQEERERQQRLEDQRREAERQQEQRRLAEQKRTEQLEAQRREQIKRQEAAEKARLEQDRKEAEERRQAAAAEAKRKADADKLAQSKAALARELAEEERLAAAESSGLLDQYAEIIRQKVERNWTRPASAREGINCVVLVRQITGGDVVEVRVAECNGDAAVVRSIEAAVLKSSPLPPPPDPSLFDRSLRFDFRPRD